MRRKALIIVAIVLSFLVASSIYFFMNSTSDRLLISNLKSVNAVQIDSKRGSSVRTLNKGTINEISDYFTGIKMKKIGRDKESALITGDKLLWTVIFLDDSEVLGMAFIFTTGEILIADVKTMVGNKRTQMFMGNIEKEKLEGLNDLLNKQSNLMENVYLGG